MRLKVEPITVIIIVAFFSIWLIRLYNFKPRITCEEYKQSEKNNESLKAADRREHFYCGHHKKK